MKRFVAVLSGLLVLPAFAEVAPTYYDDMIEMVDADVVVDDADENSESGMANDAVSRPVVQPAPSSASGRNATAGRAISRAVPAAGTGTVTSRAIASRGSSNRATASRTGASGVVSRNAASRTTVARAGTTVAGTVNASDANGSAARAGATGTNASAAMNRRTTSNASNSSVARAGTISSIVQTDTVNTPLYTGRVGVRSNVGTRTPTVRIATGTGISSDSTAAVTAATMAEVTTSMDELAQLTDFCKAQYTQCMDNFCNVLDDNQGRCSCSANLSKYEKTANALKQATEELQEVAQKIQYIGLSASEVETLFTQTEAELQMQKTTDSTQLKNDLDRVKKLIVDVKSPSSASSDTSVSMDLSGLLDFSVDSTGFDLSTLFGNNNNTSSINNQRGEQLYKTAMARCKTSVLNSCTSQGVDASLITNAYDIEIDKQCIAYERALTDSNEQMTSTVRNAKSVLQKARLLVAQNKNQYDQRGCISALDSCMQDDYVCGSDYENCLDPTGRYIVNGEVVVGSAPGLPGNISGTTLRGVYQAWNYESTNPWGSGGSMSAFVDKSMLKDASSFGSSAKVQNMVGYLMQKIGYIDSNGMPQGMCASVLNKCQAFTYTGSGSNAQYKFDNAIVKQYLERTLVQVKAAQDELLSNYAEGCIPDLGSCLVQNNYGKQETDQNGNPIYSQAALQACYSLATTCKSVSDTSATDVSSVKEWVANATKSTIQ